MMGILWVLHAMPASTCQAACEEASQLRGVYIAPWYINTGLTYKDILICNALSVWELHESANFKGS